MPHWVNRLVYAVAVAAALAVLLAGGAVWTVGLIVLALLAYAAAARALDARASSSARASAYPAPPRR